MEKYFPAIFDFHFRENPHFRHEFQALMFIKHGYVIKVTQYAKKWQCVEVWGFVLFLILYVVPFWSVHFVKLL